MKYKKLLFDLEWHRDICGYSLCGDGITTYIQSSQNKWEMYRPFELKAGLVREFANIPVYNDMVDQASAISFAGKYGLLGLGGGAIVEREKLSDWAWIIQDFKKVLNAIDTNELAYDDKGLEPPIAVAPVYFNEMSYGPSLEVVVTDAQHTSDRDFQLLPNSLFDAMWLMLASEMTHGVQYQECQAPNCGNWFRIRSGKKTCSASCRKRLHRYQRLHG